MTLTRTSGCCRSARRASLRHGLRQPGPHLAQRCAAGSGASRRRLPCPRYDAPCQLRLAAWQGDCPRCEPGAGLRRRPTRRGVARAFVRRRAESVAMAHKGFRSGAQRARSDRCGESRGKRQVSCVAAQAKPALAGDRPVLPGLSTAQLGTLHAWLAQGAPSQGCHRCRRPCDDPGVERVYYRLEREPESGSPRRGQGARLRRPCRPKRARLSVIP